MYYFAKGFGIQGQKVLYKCQVVLILQNYSLWKLDYEKRQEQNKVKKDLNKYLILHHPGLSFSVYVNSWEQIPIFYQLSSYWL